jgi:mannose-1-phosphate guanylyltransferase
MADLEQGENQVGGAGYAVILAGGRGERFWPLSTSKRPKQLLSLVGESTLLAQAVDRLSGLIPPERVFVITSADLVEASRRAAPQLPPEQIIGEPVGRDTAAAAALGAALVKARDPRGTFCILTADHIIGDLEVYRATLRESLALAAAEDVLITIGIQPTEPSTAYGYIQATQAHAERDGVAFLKADQFVEKPDRATAESYLAAGTYFWNGGMFIWSVASLQQALQAHRPALAELIDQLAGVAGTAAFDAALAAAYDGLEKISIDYALMEKADNILMVRGQFAWDDVGSWPALENHFERNADGNIALGDCAALDASGNLVYSKDRLTALIGVHDLVVVQAEGVTLICPRDRAQDIKQLVVQLREGGAHADLL